MDRIEIRKLETINQFAKGHSYQGGLLSLPKPYVETPEEQDNYNTPSQDAKEWGTNGHPDWVHVEEEIDDGDSHDVSTVVYYIAQTKQGDIHIFSYNNNAWGHCDIFESYETPKDISDWLSSWDELPEEWLKDYICVNDTDD